MSTRTRGRLASIQRRRQDEAGLTLAEMIISTVIVGIIGAAIAGAFFSVIRSEQELSDRLGTARIGDTLNMWFAADVASAVPTEVLQGSAGSWMCGGTAPGTNVLRLTQTGIWPGQTTATTRYVSYQVVPGVPPSPYKLSRYVCASGAPAEEVRIAGRLKLDTDASPQVTPLAPSPATLVTLSVRAVGLNGTEQTFVVSARPRKVT